MNSIRFYLYLVIYVSFIICPSLVYFFPDYFYGILAFQVFIFITSVVNAYYLKKKYLEKQRAYRKRFEDLANRMNKLFGEDWSNLKWKLLF